MPSEKLKPTINLEAIAESYGYERLSFDNDEPRTTEAEWSQFYKSLQNTDLKQGENNFKLNESAHICITLLAGGIDVTYKTKYTTSEFSWNKTEWAKHSREWAKYNNVWSCGHRIVAPKLRGQGVGSHLLHLSEKIIQKLADQDDGKQLCCLDVAQIDVWSFLLVNGYVVKNSASDFHDLLSELQNGASDIRIDFSGYVERMPDGTQMRFLFEKIITPKDSASETADQFRQRTKKISE